MFFNKFSKLCKVIGSEYLSSPIGRPSNAFYVHKREITFLLEWFINVFNGVDKERLKLVGPNCACAEWLLRNGASVRFKGDSVLISDYNELIKLEESLSANLKIEEIYAKGADLNTIGFNHLKNCENVRKITLIFCSRINDSTLEKLHYVKNSLEYLELRSCFNVGDKGLKTLHELRNLRTLILADLASVKKKKDCEDELRNALPQCKIDFHI